LKRVSPWIDFITLLAWIFQSDIPEDRRGSFVSGGIRVKIVDPISRCENAIQVEKNKQSACEIVI